MSKRKHPNTNGHERPDQDPGTGQFLTGNQAAKGRRRAKYAVRRAQLTERMMNAVEDHLDELVNTLIARAKAGEGWAMKLLLDRCLGRPGEGLRPSAVDVMLDYDAKQVAEVEAWLDIHGQAILDEPDAKKMGVTREELRAARLNPRNLLMDFDS